MVARKSTFWTLAVLAVAPFQAVSADAMSKEGRAAHLAKLKAGLKLTAGQTVQTEKLLGELENLRQSIAAAQNALQGARPPRDVLAKKEAAVITAKEAFRKRQEDGFREILTPEQFNKWQILNTFPSPRGPAGEHHQHQPGRPKPAQDAGRLPASASSAGLAGKL